MDVLIFILISLSVWRLAHMIAKEDGPFDIFFRIRVKLGAFFNPATGNWESTNVFGAMLLCPLCLSVWFAIPFAIFYTENVRTGILCWLASSAIASLLEIGVWRLNND